MRIEVKGSESKETEYEVVADATDPQRLTVLALGLCDAIGAQGRPLMLGDVFVSPCQPRAPTRLVGIVESVRPDTILVRTSVENLSAFPLDEVTRLELSRGTSRPTWSLAAHTAVSGRRCRQCDGAGRRTGDLGHGRRRYALLGVGALGVANAAPRPSVRVYIAACSGGAQPWWSRRGS